MAVALWAALTVAWPGEPALSAARRGPAQGLGAPAPPPGSVAALASHQHAPPRFPPVQRARLVRGGAGAGGAGSAARRIACTACSARRGASLHAAPPLLSGAPGICSGSDRYFSPLGPDNHQQSSRTCPDHGAAQQLSTALSAGRPLNSPSSSRARETPNRHPLPPVALCTILH